MYFFKKYSFIFLFAGCFVIISGCTTKKNTVVTRSFHNLTSRFNGYYYATESVKEGVAKIEATHKDNYSKILSVFIYATPAEAKSIYAEMDKAIKKSSLVIQHHTITDKKGDEIPGAVKWIDDNYLLIGKAHFYKHDYFSALEAFDYVSKAYKKQKIRYNAMFWKIRTYNEMGSFSLSEPLITLLNNDKKLPKDLMAEFLVVSADYHIQRGDYHNAIKPLTKAITLLKKKKDRARYTYILAQLYQKEENAKKASKYYDAVVKMNPSYEMAFNAKLNRAKLFDINSKQGKDIKKELLKMLKDEKNAEYLDQIYYVLGEIAEKENDIDATIEYLKLSVSSSVSNNNQKSLSYLKLADINFEQAEYKSASAYYDSTMTFLAKDYPKYDLISDRKKSLTSLVNNLNVIAMEDSLQMLAKMSEKEREAVIGEIIANIEKEEKRKAEEKEEKESLQNNDFQFNQNMTTQSMSPQQAAGGMWYFYNPSAISFGLAEFTKKWGNRQREDNWRRGNKESILVVQAETEEEKPVNESAESAAESPKTTTTDLKNKEYYLKSIPLTEPQLKKSHEKIIDAFYNVGSIYKEQLQNNGKSAETFEELLKRYKENKYKLSVYYQLYRLYLAMGNETQADIYKNILLTNYPETEYAKLITTIPDSEKGTITNASEIEQFYTETYLAYTEGKYIEVIGRCKRADSLYFKNSLMPKFDYLKALCIGRTQDVKAFELALTQVIVKHPKDEVKNSAQEMLDFIKNRKNAPEKTITPEAPPDPETKEKYQLNENAEYYWIVIIPNKKNNINNFKTALSDFNNKSYSTAELNINTAFLDSASQMISVKKFTGKDKAMDYYDFLNNSKDVFKTIEVSGYQTFIISSDNFNLFYREKDLQGYLNFFRESFLNQ